MPRRQTKNKTNIPRIEGISMRDAHVHYVCVSCGLSNFVNIGSDLLSPKEAYETQEWVCQGCGFVHSKNAPLPVEDQDGNPTPFASWSSVAHDEGELAVLRFWEAFFRGATEKREVYWKQCNTCGRILPENDFSRHVDWGPLEKQMECRACKAVINTDLNPKRTKEQLHESSSRRRAAELLLNGQNERLSLRDLFDRFEGRCFKTGIELDYDDRGSWAVDHVLPSRWLYPLSITNAALLSTDANNNKRDRWPSEFYTNEELKRLAAITGADLALISSTEPIINPNIDVDACVSRFLTVRGATSLTKRIGELKKLLEDYNLVDQLSAENKKMLGY